MALTHVRMWSDNSWKRVSAREAAQLFPYGASAESGLFMCELCGQYVTLTNGKIQTRHFRHSAKSQDKDCEDRSTIYGYSNFFQAEEHNLPIKIRIINREKFELELGFIPILQRIKLDNHTLTILNGYTEKDRFVYSLDRLAKDGVTYFFVGNEPAERYRIYLTPEVPGINFYWPKFIDGIPKDGAFFDGITHKKLPYGADVEVGHEYYLLVKGSGRSFPKSVNAEEICSSRKGWISWSIYRIVATEFSKTTAMFFHDYNNSQLTYNPIKMFPVWPPYVKNPYVLYHNAKELYVYLKGEGEAKVSPAGNIKYLDSNLISISVKDRQQLLSIGRTKVLNYMYFCKGEIDQKRILPSVTVTDIKGNELQSEKAKHLPYKNTIIIHPDVDGEIELVKEGTITYKAALKANNDYTLDGIKYGVTVRVYQGCDIVWKCTYTRQRAHATSFQDELLYQKLCQCNGHEIPISHSFGSVEKHYHNYPMVKRWIYKKIRAGKMPEDAYKLIKRNAGV